jgi:TolB-like protein/DNA-binding SARP family transcriptional activator
MRNLGIAKPADRTANAAPAAASPGVGAVQRLFEARPRDAAALPGLDRSGAPAAAGYHKGSRIHLLGRARVLAPNGQDIIPSAKRTQAVLAYLCFARGELLDRSLLAQLIWDQSGESQARDNLRHALIELDRAGASWRLDRQRNTVRFDKANCWIDAFETPARGDMLLRELSKISASFDNWLRGERVRFELHWQTVLEERLAALNEQQAPVSLRMAAARELLNIVPTHDEAVCNLMAAFAEMDNLAEAVREFDRFEEECRRTASPPSNKTLAMIEAIRVGLRTKFSRSDGRSPQAENSAGKPEAQSQREADTDLPGLGLGTEPKIAVLPIRRLSPVKNGDFLAEGLFDDLTETLSRVPGLSVISRFSAAAIKRQDRTSREIGEALGVRYVLSGSLRVLGDKLRLVVELTDTTTNGLGARHSRFDETFSDLFDVQGRLADQVARWIAPQLHAAEIKRVLVKRPEYQGAYDLLLRGQEQMHSLLERDFAQAGECFTAAIERAPEYAKAHAWLAHWHVTRVGQGWSEDPAGDALRAEQSAMRAVKCDGSEPLALAIRGHVASYFRKDFDLALSCFERAFKVSPSDARTWLWSAFTHAWIDRGPIAVEHVNRAISLSPYDPLIHIYSGGASLAYLSDGQYARSIEFALRCVRENAAYTTAYKALILARMLSGYKAEARASANQLRALEPTFTIEQFRRYSPACTGRLGEVYCEAFAAAGIPPTSPKGP